MRASDGGSAFPEITTDRDGSGFANVYSYGGMSLRDYFAAKALAALASVEAFQNPDKAAVWAYEFADAMLTAREAK